MRYPPGAAWLRSPRGQHVEIVEVYHWAIRVRSVDYSGTVVWEIPMDWPWKPCTPLAAALLDVAMEGE